MSQRFNRVHVSSSIGWIEAEDQAYGAADAEGQHQRAGCDQRAHVAEVGHAKGDGQANDDPHNAPEQCQEQRLRKELDDDVTLAGPESAANPDLAGPLADRGHHDIHDADAAHQQRDGGDRSEDHREDPLHVPRSLHEFQGDNDLIVVLLVRQG